MIEPTTSTAISVTAAGGITIVGVATGLDPSLLLAGACGGWWALSYMDPQSLLARVHHIAMSAVVAAWGAPVLVGWLGHLTTIPESIPSTVLHYAAALCIGLVAVPVLGRAVMQFARSKLRDHGGR